MLVSRFIMQLFRPLYQHLFGTSLWYLLWQFFCRVLVLPTQQEQVINFIHYILSKIYSRLYTYIEICIHPYFLLDLIYNAVFRPFLLTFVWYFIVVLLMAVLSESTYSAQCAQHEQLILFV